VKTESEEDGDLLQFRSGRKVFILGVGGEKTKPRFDGNSKGSRKYSWEATMLDRLDETLQIFSLVLLLLPLHEAMPDVLNISEGKSSLLLIKGE